MEATRQFEKTVEGWYKNIPHLPKNAQVWLADNVWWIALISVILGVLGLFTLVPAALYAFGIMSSVAGVYALSYSAPYYWLVISISLIGLLVTTIITALAISPLKAKTITGWQLLFLTLIANFFFNVLSNIMSLVLTPGTYGPASLITGLLGVALSFLIGGYFLFEIRDRFKPVGKVKAKTSKK